MLSLWTNAFSFLQIINATCFWRCPTNETFHMFTSSESGRDFACWSIVWVSTKMLFLFVDKWFRVYVFKNLCLKTGTENIVLQIKKRKNKWQIAMGIAPRGNKAAHGSVGKQPSNSYSQRNISFCCQGCRKLHPWICFRNNHGFACHWNKCNTDNFTWTFIWFPHMLWMERGWKDK